MRPPGRVVVVGVRRSQVVQVAQVVGHVVRVGVEELVLVDRAVRAALTGRAVVRAVHDDRVVQLTGLLEVVDDPTDLGVGELRESGVDLGHPREQPLLVVVERGPGADVVDRRRGLAGERVDVGELGALGQDAALDHPREHPLAVGLVAVVELPGVLRDVLLRGVVRSVVRAGAEPQVPGLLGRGRLAVGDERDRFVGQVLGQVVAVLGHRWLVDVVVVLDQRRVPVVGLAADEPVEAVEAARERPVALARADRPLVQRHIVVLSDPERVVTVLPQHLSDGGVLHRDMPGVAREPLGAFGDLGEAVLVMVAPGQQARASGRAQCGGVPLGVGEAVVRQPLHGRHVDPTAVRRPRRQPGVVVQHQ